MTDQTYTSCFSTSRDYFVIFLRHSEPKIALSSALFIVLWRRDQMKSKNSGTRKGIV